MKEGNGKDGKTNKTERERGREGSGSIASDDKLRGRGLGSHLMNGYEREGGEDVPRAQRGKKKCYGFKVLDPKHIAWRVPKRLHGKAYIYFYGRSLVALFLSRLYSVF